MQPQSNQVIASRVPTNNVWPRVVATVTALLLLTSSSSADDGFVDVLTAQWKVLAEADRSDKQYSVTHLAELEKHVGNSLYAISAASSCGKLESENDVRCWNPHYSFNLKRSKQQDSAWLIGNLVPGAPEGNSLRQMILTNGFDVTYIFPLTGFFWDSTCDTLLQKGSLTITEHTPEADLVRVTFRVKIGDSRQEDLAGSMLLDPRANYVVVEAMLTRDREPNPKGAKQIRLTRQCESVDGKLVSKLVKYEAVDKRARESDEFNFKGYRFVSVPQTEFLVSHYGLPELLQGTPQKPPPTYLWLLLASAGFALAAAGFAFIRRRSTANAAGRRIGGA